MNAVAIPGGAPWAVLAAVKAGVPLSQMAHEPWTARYVFLLNWSERLTGDVLERYEVVNFHCTPLPYGRGGHPIEGMILAGHESTVITAHRVTAQLDAGPIYCTRGPISLSGSKEDICERFIEPVAEMMRWIMETNPTPQPQVGEPVYFKRLSPDEYRHFWRARNDEGRYERGC